MCHGLEKRHFQCGHWNTFVITARCTNAIETGIDCLVHQCSFLEGEIVKSPLCVKCYRKTEEEICDHADDALVMIKESCENAKNELKNNPNLSDLDRELLQEEIDDAPKQAAYNRQERAGILKEFRKSQGVWGDG